MVSETIVPDHGDPEVPGRSDHAEVREIPVGSGSGVDRPLFLAATGLRKSYRKGQIEVPVLRGVSVEVTEGEFLAIVGQSGSGKSTLLHLLGTLDPPDAGEIRLRGRRIDNLPGREKDSVRNREFGMIFQFYHLLPELTTLENVLMPVMIRHGMARYVSQSSEYRRRARALCERVGLSHRLNHRPAELSGGEMQRAAIARALVADPPLLLADEPTGNLDHQTGRQVLEILRDLRRERNLTIVMVTHDLSVAATADRTFRIVDGQRQSGDETS
ncbi:MAG: ABC transporter ATP-binding protein [Planctomycetia bacterium]|nr:ABC transporter ATP-binding protein [Planctomycetia bacterium]